MSICGIYAIENMINEKIYIGQSVDIRKRFREHEKMLRLNKHTNKNLQRAWNKYGKENFSFKIIERCNEAFLNEKETHHIKTYKKSTKLYNFTNGGCGIRGYKHTEETKIKISEAGKNISQETRAKLSAANSGRRHTEETKLKCRNAKLGYKHTEKSIEKMRAAKLGKITSEETKAKIGAAFRGKKLTEEHKAKISASHLGLPGTMLGRKHSEETKAKISATEKMTKAKKGALK